MAALSKKELVAQALHRSGCGWALRRTSCWRGILILNYHRVGDGSQSSLDRHLWSATEAEFDQQIRMVSREFQVVGLDGLQKALHDPLGRYVMITFDDGYRDNYEIAYPILKKYNATATFFISTGMLDIPKVPWWDEIAWMVRSSSVDHLEANQFLADSLEFRSLDRDREINLLQRNFKKMDGSVTERYLDDLAIRLKTGRAPIQIARELWMSWDSIREMRNNGMTFGGHTVNHPVLSNLSAEEQDHEVGFCKQRLLEELGEPIDAFSYPVGGPTSFNQFTIQALEKYGFQWGFTYFGGHVRPGTSDRYRLARTAIELDITLPIFQAIATLPQYFA